MKNSFTKNELLELRRMGINPKSVEIMQEGGEMEGEQEQMMQLIQAYAQMSQTDPQEIMTQLEQMQPEQQQQAVQQMAQQVQQAMAQGPANSQGMPQMQMGGLTPEEQMMQEQMMMEQQAGMQEQPQGGGEQEQMMQILQAYAEMNQMSEEEFNQLITMFQNATPEEQQQMLQEIVAELEGATQQQAPEQMASPEEQAMMEQQAMQEEPQPMMYNGGYMKNLRSLQKGGSMNPMQYKYEDQFNPNVNVEDKEVIRTPQGEAFKVGGDTHAEGGIDMNLQPGSQVFSEYIKAPSDIVKRFVDNNKSKKKMSFADLAGKYTTEKELQTLEDPNADKYKKATAMINMEMKNEKLNQIFEAQEYFKRAAGLDKIEYTDGSTEKAKNGTSVKKKPFQFL
jgi:hypothetical protein